MSFQPRANSRAPAVDSIAVAARIEQGLFKRTPDYLHAWWMLVLNVEQICFVRRIVKGKTEGVAIVRGVGLLEDPTVRASL